MPNWVRNEMKVEGPVGSLAKFRFDMSMPVPYAERENDQTRTANEPLVLAYSETIFSFWNIIAPDKEYWSLYFGMKGWKNGESHGDTPYNWYNWNVSNWGCKWDAREVEQVYQNDASASEIGFWHIQYHTPWSPPEPVFDALSAKYPDLTFKHRYTEEQGWGGEVEYSDGEQVDSRTWDIPTTHAETVVIFEECPCQWDQDYERYEDCPKEEKNESQSAPQA